MERLRRLEDDIAPTLEAMGFAVVRAVLLHNGAKRTVQVMAERDDGSNVTIEDCADISRTLSAVFDVKDPVTGPYVLEVSSPGIDRPLTRRSDFERFAGLDAKLETKMPIDGRKRFSGVLDGIGEDDIIHMTVEEGPVQIAFTEVDKAKLILTDALLAMGQDQANQS